VRLSDLPGDHECDDMELARLVAMQVMRFVADDIEQTDRARAAELRRTAMAIDEGDIGDIGVGIAFVAIGMGREAAEIELARAPSEVG
jgi:hypothetical protein